MMMMILYQWMCRKDSWSELNKMGDSDSQGPTSRVGVGDK